MILLENVKSELCDDTFNISSVPTNDANENSCFH